MMATVRNGIPMVTVNTLVQICSVCSEQGALLLLVICALPTLIAPMEMLQCAIHKQGVVKNVQILINFQNNAVTFQRSLCVKRLVDVGQNV